MDKKGIYLILGIVVTVLFVLLRENVYYGLLYQGGGFSEDLVNCGVIMPITLVMVAMAWGGAAIYYYVINSVKFDRWYHWLAVLAVVAVVTPVICYCINNAIFNSYDVEHGAEMINLELSNILIEAILFTVASFSMRWWSSNCRHTPIPQ